MDPTLLTDFFGGPGSLGPRPARVFRYGTYRALSRYLVSLSPLRASRTNLPPSVQGLRHWVSPHSRQKNLRRSTLPIGHWKSLLGVAEQTLKCPSKVIGFTLIFPEDLGGHKTHGPSSLWVLREFRLLEGTRDARRAAGYLCQFTRADYKRPIGVLSNCTQLRSRLSLGWPSFQESQDKLVCKGPLPLRCSCGFDHTLMIGVSEDDTFRTLSAAGFGTEFWASCVYDATPDEDLVSLRDEGQCWSHSCRCLSFACFVFFVFVLLLCCLEGWYALSLISGGRFHWFRF